MTGLGAHHRAAGSRTQSGGLRHKPTERALKLAALNGSAAAAAVGGQSAAAIEGPLP